MKKKFEIRNFAVLVATSLLLFSCGQSSNKQHSSVDSTKCDSVSHKKVATVTQTKESQTSITPQKALEMLKEGNFRFTSNQVLKRDFKSQVHQTAEGQFPFAFVISCMDSRTSAVHVFDQGIGDIFEVRIAGNFSDDTEILGSMEYATQVAGAKLIVVMGHTHCGAAKGAADNVKLGNLSQLLTKLKPAVDASTNVKGEHNSHNSEYVDAIAHNNVINSIKAIKEKSKVVKELIANGKVLVVGAMYNLETGKVEFLETK